MALEPITRQEKIIAGQDLTPITRMEMFLKQFGGGGSGLPSGGAPYQQLVTDGEGNAKWEDRLAYREELVSVDMSEGMVLCKVSSRIPDGITDGFTATLWLSDGYSATGNATKLGDNIYELGSFVFITTADNCVFQNVTFPEKGIYFLYAPAGSMGEVGMYVCGLAFGEATEPEITWDGNAFSKKVIDISYLPLPELDERYSASSSAEFIITLTPSGEGPSGERYTSDKTWDELKAFCDSNPSGRVVAYYHEYGSGTWIYTLSRIDNYDAYFVEDGGSILNFSRTTETRKELVLKDDPKSLPYPSSAPKNKYQLVQNIDGVWTETFPTQIIMTSSTEGSTKKFKIAVDDSGTISATEVTS